MKAISVYALTREQNIHHLQKLERQLSERDYFLKIKEWELNSMKGLVKQLEGHMKEVYALRFFYSFQIPKLGKEFDLLQIKEDQILNLELKSGIVSDEAIRKQLIQNRYYLSVLGRTIRSYTYISSQNRLVRLTNHDHIVEADWEQLCQDLQQESADYNGDVEDLFQAELYLISPITEPGRFLRKEYFLTSQQRDIERQILKGIRQKHTGYYWFIGLPGTGKTLLLYDLAMKLSGRQKVCLIHCGRAGKEWRILHERLRRIDYLSDEQIHENKDLSEYNGVLIDEAHLLSEENLQMILEACGQQPVIFSSDCEDIISQEEFDRSTVKAMRHLPEMQTYHLTNRIRTNAELSSFIQHMMHLPKQRYARNYPHITVFYANDEIEAENLLCDARRQGYFYPQDEIPDYGIDCLVVQLDSRYYYDEQKFLRSTKPKRSEQSDVRKLFHQLNQAKESLILVIKENPAVYETLLDLLQ